MHHHIPPPASRGFANTPAPFNEGKVPSYMLVSHTHHANSALHTEALKPFSMLCHAWRCNCNRFCLADENTTVPWQSLAWVPFRNLHGSSVPPHTWQRRGPFQRGLASTHPGLHRWLSAPSMITIYKALIAPASECPHRQCQGQRTDVSRRCYSYWRIPLDKSAWLSVRTAAPESSAKPASGKSRYCDLTRRWQGLRNQPNLGRAKPPLGAAGPDRPFPPNLGQSTCCPQWHKAWTVPNDIPLLTGSTGPSVSDTSWLKAAAFYQLCSGVAALCMPLPVLDKNGQRCSTEKSPTKAAAAASPSSQRHRVVSSQKHSRLSSLLLFSWF